MKSALALVACIWLGIGCTEVSGFDDEPGDGEEMPDTEEPGDVPTAAACSKMDIVFIIDDSGSMAEEQANLATNFGSFVEVIDGHQNTDGDFLDYRLAVGTTGRDVSFKLGDLSPPLNTATWNDAGDNGVFRQECGMTRRWIERNDSDVASTFACAAAVGTDGPRAEMPLLGLEWGLGRRVEDGTNDGFLREDALLSVVVLTDQDDCSREDDDFTITGDTCFDAADPNIIPLDFYLGFLDGLKQSRERWATAVIAGPGPGKCQSSFGTAASATRLQEFVSQAGTNARFSSICEGDLTVALGEALDTFTAACETFPPVVE